MGVLGRRGFGEVSDALEDLRAFDVAGEDDAGSLFAVGESLAFEYAPADVAAVFGSRVGAAGVA